jgi:hypothetical protein
MVHVGACWRGDPQKPVSKALQPAPVCPVAVHAAMHSYEPAPIRAVKNFACETGATPAPCALDMGTPAGPMMAPNYVYPEADRTMGFAVQWTPGPVSAACSASVPAMYACNEEGRKATHSTKRGGTCYMVPVTAASSAVHSRCHRRVAPSAGNNVLFWRRVVRRVVRRDCITYILHASDGVHHRRELGRPAAAKLNPCTVGVPLWVRARVSKLMSNEHGAAVWYHVLVKETVDHYAGDAGPGRQHTERGGEVHADHQPNGVRSRGGQHIPPGFATPRRWPSCPPSCHSALAQSPNPRVVRHGKNQGKECKVCNQLQSRSRYYLPGNTYKLRLCFPRTQLAGEAWQTLSRRTWRCSA